MSTINDFEKIAYKTFSKKYKFEPTQFHIIVTDNIIFNEKCHLVSLFKDYLIIDDINEFLKRYYTKAESVIRIKKYIDYYETYNFIYPNYTSIPESIFIYHNIHKKQRILDEQEKIERERLSKLNNSSLSKNNKTVFNNSAYDSILQPSSNLYNSIFGIDDDKNEDSIEELNKLIDNMSNKNIVYKEDLKKMAGKQYKKFPICIRIHYPGDKSKKKPDLSPINFIKIKLPSPAKNALKTVVNNSHLKLKSLETLYSKNNINKEQEKNGIENIKKKNLIVNHSIKNSCSNINNQLIYRKLNPIDKERQNNYFSVNYYRHKKILTTGNIDSYSPSKYNKIINTKSNFYIKKINNMKKSETYRENYNKNNLPINSKVINGKLAEILKSFKYKNSIYQKNKSESKTDRKSNYKFINKNIISTNNQLFQSLSNNNGIKNNLFKELELYTIKSQKKYRKITPLRLNNLPQFETKNSITSGVKNKSTITTEPIMRHKKIIENKNLNFKNNNIFLDSYLKKNYLSSSCNNFLIKNMNNNFNTLSKNSNTITPDENYIMLKSDQKIPPLIQSKYKQIIDNKSLTTKKSTIQNSDNNEGRFKKVKSVNNGDTNNKNKLFFKKRLIEGNDLNLRQNKTSLINKNCFNINYSKGKNSNNDLYNNHTYLETDYNSLSNYYKNMINSKINKNTINFINNNIINFNNNEDINKKYLKTEESKKGSNLMIKGKKKIIIIKKNHKNSNKNINSFNNNMSYKNNDTINNQNSKLTSTNLTERTRTENTSKNIGAYNDKKINDNSLKPANINNLKRKLNFQYQIKTNNKPGNDDYRKLDFY